MSKTNEEFMKQQLTGSIGGDEDFLYEQYIAQEQMNEEYWQWKSVQSHSIFPDEDYIYEQYLAQEKMNEEYHEWRTKQVIESIYPNDIEYYESTYTPTIEEQLELDELLKKQNGYT